MDTQHFPLHEAARDGKVLLVKGLVSQNPKDVLVKDLDDKTPLHWAVAFNQLEIASILLNPTKFQKQDGDKPLVKPFEIDLDDYVDASNWTVIHVAASVGNLEMLQLLLDHEPHADVNLQTSSGLTAIHLATSKKHLDIVKELVKRGGSVRIKDRFSQLPLHRAASVGSIGLVKYLVEEAKSPLNAKDKSGWTALHHSLAEGFGDVAVLLVKLGADYKIEDSDGLTPLKVAVDEKVAKYFKGELAALGVDL